MDENRIKEYTLENGKTFTAYIPENISNDTPIFYYSYVVGSDYETDKLWKNMEEDMYRHAGDAVVIIPHDKQLVIGGTNVETHKYQTNAVNIFNAVKEDLGIETTQFINGGFSAGFGYGTRTLAHYLQENPNAERQILFAVDGVINPQANLQASELQALKDNNTLIISFTQQKNHKYQANLFKSTELPILYIVDNSIPENTPDSDYWRIHDQVAADFYDKGLYTMLIDFALGKKDLVLPEGYSLRYYDPTTKQITQITATQAVDLLGIVAASNISTVSLNNLKNLADLTIESNDKTLENYLNEIRGTIRNTNFLQGDFSKISYASTTKVPSQITDVISAYFQATSSLLTKIANETVQFAKIAESYENLDFNLSQKVEDITTETLIADKTTNTSNISPNLSGLVGPITGGIAGAITSNTTNQSQNMQSNSVQRPQQNTSPNQNNTNQSTNNNINQQEPPTPKPEETSPLDEFPKYEELYSDDTKIVYNYNDEYKIIIHKDGDKVIGIEHYYDFQTSDQATAALETLKTEYSTYENFDKIVQKDRYLKVLFKKESYHELTITDIKEEFSNFEEVIKGGI